MPEGYDRDDEPQDEPQDEGRQRVSRAGARARALQDEPQDEERSKPQRVYDDFNAGRLNTNQALRALLALASGNDADVYADEDPDNR